MRNHKLNKCDRKKNTRRETEPEERKKKKRTRNVPKERRVFATRVSFPWGESERERDMGVIVTLGSGCCV